MAGAISYNFLLAIVPLFLLAVGLWGYVLRAIESSNIKSDPSLKSETSFILHEGTKVQIIAEDEDWYRILLADGKDGWIHQIDLKPL